MKPHLQTTIWTLLQANASQREIERVLVARRLLQNIHDGETIATVAHDCGFVSQSAFSIYYREYFGELPSETVAKRFGTQGHT